MRVIVIPADPSQPCTAVTVSGDAWHSAIGRLVGRPAERAVYDRDAVLWLNGDGAAALPPNRRATQYAFGHSAAAARDRTDPAAPPYHLHGTVVVTGAGPDEEAAPDVPGRLYALFGVERDDEPGGPVPLA